jgi:amino acid permease
MFILTFAWLLLSKPWKDEVGVLTNQGYLAPSMDYKMVGAVSNILVAFCFVTSLFPMQQSLADKSGKNTMKAVRQSIFMSFFTYSLIGILGSLFYGQTVKIDVLQNLGEDPFTSNLIMLGTFIVILACHIPYIFFSCKECSIILVDEWMNQSLSHDLEKQ